MFEKRGSFWKWFWFAVVLVPLGFGLYYLISYVANIDTIRASVP